MLWLRHILGTASLVLLLCAAGLGQRTSPSAQPNNPFNDSRLDGASTVPVEMNSWGTTLHVTVLSEASKKLDRQSLVRLTSKELNISNWQTTNELSEAAFGEVVAGHYDVEVSAVGYLTAHKEVQVVGYWAPIRLEINLQRDPAAVNLGIEEAVLPHKARNNAKHGLSALKSGKWNKADKQLEEAYKLAPNNADLNFLLGYVAYQKKNYGRASEFLDTSANLSPHNVQALTLLGRVNIEREDYGRAISYLEKAIVADSEYWVAHDLLATSYLKQRAYEKARDQAQLAIEKGKRDAAASQLVLGQALVNLGQRQEGIRTLKDFVEAVPNNPSVPQVKDLIAKLETDSEPRREDGPAPAQIAGVDPMLAVAAPALTLKPWQPPGIDEEKPLVASGVNCPAENVLQQTGERAQDLMRDVSRIAAIEHLVHERLDEVGTPVLKETRTFNYVASISESPPGFLSVDEYRSEHLGLSDFPEHIASSGFATLGLVFYPAMRDNFEMTCEGLGEWKGQAAWLVHFKQRDDRPARMHDYKVGSNVYALKLKGRAWISADNFEILRIESELVSPVPEIRLASEHQVVEYGPVLFTKKNVQLWLPKSAEIYLDFRRHRYYRSHTFDHYMLFSVDATDQPKAPKGPTSQSRRQ